ncbi:DNA polymerase III subunit gamma/tau [uncultured Acidaminococcus sp.]|uniref:DNA polymerase III subunit gamma/tau n=1 Tax=uncultured Acidaminococcus sp. TaxID=352152 RepID=UPI0026226C29|nr:DNA polymerase III subunit gamma/tau [uncultured Acidaminococcus sp.]
MAYVALYRTWRPQDFDDLVGQAPIKKALTNALETGRISHAYLFAGPRGTGKTSTARILAKALNCAEGPTPHPCNHCENCREITEGTSGDVIEIDAASNRGIDEIRKIREQVYFAPVSSRYKVYIIDEVHMITTDAFNALLKTLEEPPEHVVFILATTEPQKILNTILSRCQRFDFRRATVDEIAAHLAKVAKGSHIQAEPEALRLMAIQADGGLRDALSLLDQCSIMADKVTEETVRQVLGLVGREKLRELIVRIGQKDLPGALDTLDRLLEQGKEMEQILGEMMEYFRALLLFQADREYQEIYLTDTREALEQTASLFTSSQIIAAVERLHEAVKESKYSLRKKIVGELCLFDLCQNRGNTEAALLARIESLEKQVAALEQGGLPAAPAVRQAVSVQPVSAPIAVQPAPAARPASPVRREPVPAAARPVQAAGQHPGDPRDAFARMAAAVRREEKRSSQPAAPAEVIQVSRPDPVSRPGPAAVGSAAGRESCFDGSGRALGEQLWQRVLQGLKRRRKRTFLVYAEMARVADCQDRELLLAVNSSFEKERLEDPAFKTLIQDILKETTGEAVRLQVVQQEGEITLHKFRVPAPAPAEPAPVPPPPPAEDIPLPDEPPADVAPSLPSGRQEPQPAAAAANPAPEPVKQGELPEGVKKAMQVFGGEVYKE